jgi:hypothetical protein
VSPSPRSPSLIYLVSQHIRLGQHRLFAPGQASSGRVLSRGRQARFSCRWPEIQYPFHPSCSQSSHTNYSNRFELIESLQRSTGELASYQQKMFRIDDHVGIAIAGLTSDARVLRFALDPTCMRCQCLVLPFSNFMRQQSMASRMLYNRPVPVNRLVSAIADSK